MRTRDDPRDWCERLAEATRLPRSDWRIDGAKVGDCYILYWAGLLVPCGGIILKTESWSLYVEAVVKALELRRKFPHGTPGTDARVSLLHPVRMRPETSIFTNRA